MVTLALTLLAGMALVSLGVGAAAVGYRKPGQITVAEGQLGGASDWVKVVTEATLDVIPDTAVVKLELRVCEPTLALAHEGARRQVEQVQALLRGIGIAPERARVETYQLKPTVDDPPSCGVGSALRVELTDFRQIKSLLQQVTSRGLAPWREVRFAFQKREEAGQRLLAEAFQRARLQAETLAAESGRRLGRLSSASVHLNDGSQEHDFAALPPDFAPRNIRFTARVEAHYCTELC